VRPRLRPAAEPWSTLPGGAGGRGRRTIFIQTETTPNVDALKFLPNHRILPQTISTPFIEYLNPRSTIAPPYPSPLAAQLMNIDGVTAVFYGADFITVTKAADANWAHIRPEIFSLITEAITSGQTIVNVSERGAGDGTEAGGATHETEDSLSYNENDSEVVGMIKELLETRIRPAIQEDGGDIEYRGFKDGNVLLKLRGACRTCDSSTVTLKNGIEGMLMHYVSSCLPLFPSLCDDAFPANKSRRSRRSRVSITSWTRRKRLPCKSLQSSRRSSRHRKAPMRFHPRRRGRALWTQSRASFILDSPTERGGKGRSSGEDLICWLIDLSRPNLLVPFKYLPKLPKPCTSPV